MTRVAYGNKKLLGFAMESRTHEIKPSSQKSNLIWLIRGNGIFARICSIIKLLDAEMHVPICKDTISIPWRVYLL
jgi:hypothetical protein